MIQCFPGTEIEVSKLERGASKVLFDGIFATGGITLSQVSVMTGLEPYIIQNWVKRGFVSSPVKRMYSRAQFARIVIINMLKEALQLDKICELVKIIGGNADDPSDDLIGDNILYHIYVDIIASEKFDVLDEKAVEAAVEKGILELSGFEKEDLKKLKKILEIMIYAHGATKLKAMAAEALLMLD